MRALLIDRVGAADVLRLADAPMPRPGPGDVLIRVAYAGVNPADWKCREGYLGAFMTYTFPFVIGFDAAGVVEAVGGDVTGFEPGMRVFAQTDVGAGRWGAYAEYVAVRHDSVVRLPDAVSFAAAATVPTPALAAWAGLFDDGGLEAGQTVLVHGGAGAVGTFAIQLAVQAGARVAATCSARNRETVEALGAAAAIDYRAQDIAAAVRAWTPGGVDLVLDAVGGATLPAALDLLAPGGTLVTIMTLVSGDAERLAATAAEAARRGLRTTSTYSRMPSGETLGRIAERLDRRALRVPRFDAVPLEQAARALDLVQTGEAKTKLVLHVADIAG